ncbi:MAG: hypothetical protein MK085_10425, partial [Phycisphaerales bacterium]|nr:hypothetical protein [Phycisphaerales bacterium]
MRVFLFEPRIEGHHLPWTGMIATALLDRGDEVILGHGDDPRQCDRLDDGFPGISERLERYPVRVDGRFDGGSALQAAAKAAA